MAYTNTWTTAAPLDTQAANQGAVDFRATKLDIMQRVASFGAGLLANRPTPEVTSGTADWTGVMYWATDTKQTFRWNGSSWDDITSSVPGGTTVRISNTTPVNVTDNGIGGPGTLITVPANTFSIGSSFRLKGMGTIPNGSPIPLSSISLIIGGTEVARFPLNTLPPGSFSQTQIFGFQCDGIVSDNISAQQCYGFASLGPAISAVVDGSETYHLGSTPHNSLSSGINMFMQLNSEKNTGSVVTFLSIAVEIFK